MCGVTLGCIWSADRRRCGELCWGELQVMMGYQANVLCCDVLPRDDKGVRVQGQRRARARVRAMQVGRAVIEACGSGW